ncbi:hypothetical protein QP119_06400 [Corynebacterium frankenforstense]|uniref:hypothetical protein n=1 Tax=Corynebacterium frankenforstense TaxID=1230998 RepID=UPI0025510AD6|nr:hypothetical protein [Corynebacterium frankenforstense]MDK6260047.1 hypothetical protein [Corynebacterium frankenforstense]
MFQRDQAVQEAVEARGVECALRRVEDRDPVLADLGVTGLSADVAGGGRCGEEPYVRALAGV